jgi:hypothetical protein
VTRGGAVDEPSARDDAVGRSARTTETFNSAADQRDGMNTVSAGDEARLGQTGVTGTRP